MIDSLTSPEGEGGGEDLGGVERSYLQKFTLKTKLLCHLNKKSKFIVLKIDCLLEDECSAEYVV